MGMCRKRLNWGFPHGNACLNKFHRMPHGVRGGQRKFWCNQNLIPWLAAEGNHSKDEGWRTVFYTGQ